MPPSNRLLYIGTFLALLIGCVSLEAQAEQPLESISSLDVSRYMGKWYEITKYPNWFQKNCASDTSANYSLNQDNSVTVVNRCKTPEGGFEEAVGEAHLVGGPSSPKLKVRFAPAWLSFLPLVWGDYWVVDLDANYRLAAVSEPTRKYLWVLSRSKTIDTASYQELLQRLAVKGFDLNRLEAPVGVQ